MHSEIIENQLHWRLDIVFYEDKACIRNDNVPENMNILRKWALAILVKVKNRKDRSVKFWMRRNAMSITHFVNVSRQYFMRRPCNSSALELNALRI
jgi:hypothetical protein